MYAASVHELSFLIDLNIHLNLLLIVCFGTAYLLAISATLFVTKVIINYLLKTFGEYWTVKLILVMHEILIVLAYLILCIFVLRKLFENLL